MKRLNKAIEIVHHHVTKRDNDNVWLLVGDEGKGKSNVLMHIVDAWCTLNKGVCTSEDIKSIGIDKLTFTKKLKDCERFDIIADDEAADISNKRTMSSFNVLLSQAYQIIRGENLFTILVIPSPFDLDGFFVKRRARGMIEVTARGRLRFYSKNKLKKIIELNQNRVVKRINLVRPTFVDTFPKYSGVLLEPYQEMKAEKMKSVREELYKNISEGLNGKKEDPRSKYILNMHEQGLTDGEISKYIGISRSRVTQLRNEAVNVNVEGNNLLLGETK